MPDPASSDSALPASPAGDGRGLIFDWSPVRWRRTRLLFFLGLAVGAHLLLFYLFKVAAPPAPRTVPPARSVLLLSTGSPASAALLERMENAWPALMPPMPLTEPDNEALHRLVKGYEPTWERQTARLKPLPPAATGARLPVIMPGSALLLPPLPAPDTAPAVTAAAVRTAPAAAGTAASVPAPAGAGGTPSSPVSAAVPLWSPRALPSLFVQSGLADRPLRAPPVWPAEVTQPDWPADGTASFLISVSAEGQVLSCLPLSAAAFDMEVLRRPILSAQFSPRQDSDDIAWGWIDVQW